MVQENKPGEASWRRQHLRLALRQGDLEYKGDACEGIFSHNRILGAEEQLDQSCNPERQIWQYAEGYIESGGGGKSSERSRCKGSK